MKFLVSFFVCLSVAVSITWENDFGEAKQLAAANHKYILLNFSGSDWCGPCIRMHKEIFETGDFGSFASAQLVLVNADFPRQKKNQLSKKIQQQNDQLAEQYNPGGSFPYTLLLTADGKIVKAWDGFPKQGIAEFINELKLATNGSK